MSSSRAVGGDSLPTPEDLKKYDAALPGLGRDIVQMIKAEQAHLHAVDQADISLSRRGQLFGFVIAIAFLLVSAVLVFLNHDVAGTVIGSVDLVALTTVFVIGQRASNTAIEAGRADATQKLIRELRRSGIKNAREKRPASELSVPENSTEGSTTAVSADKDSDVQQAPTEGAECEDVERITAGTREPDVDGRTPDSTPTVPRQRRSLSEADAELYRRIYNDPDWHPSASDV